MIGEQFEELSGRFLLRIGIARDRLPDTINALIDGRNFLHTLLVKRVSELPERYSRPGLGENPKEDEAIIIAAWNVERIAVNAGERGQLPGFPSGLNILDSR